MNKFFANFFFFFFETLFSKKSKSPAQQFNLSFKLFESIYIYTLTSVTSKTNCFCQIGGHKGLWDPILDESHDGFEWVKKEWREGDGTRVPAYV